MKKRVLSLITILCLLFTLLPTTAFAEDAGKITPYIYADTLNAEELTYGQTLAYSGVMGAVYSDSTKQTWVAGNFVWENETIKPTAKDDSNTTLYTVIFKPTDTATYNEVTTQITITVNKAQNAPNMPGSTMTVQNSITKVGDVTLPKDWVWQESDKDTPLEVEVAQSAIALYEGADKGNYEKESVEILIIRIACDHVPGEILYTGMREHAPDCVNDGLGHKECTKCHAVTESGIVVAALGHQGGTATCKKRRICTVCHDEYGSINPAVHAATEVRGHKSATCTTAGYTGDTYCADCGTKISSGTSVAAKGHTDANKDHVCDVETCKATISTCSGGTATCKDIAICDYCGEPYGEVESSNHAGGTEIRNAKDAACTEDGYTGDTYCKGCEVKLQDGEPITKLDHMDDDKDHVCDRENCNVTISSHSGGTATCKDLAVCDYCGEPYGELDSSNHTGKTKVRNQKDATCTEDGYTGDTYCKGCDTKLSAGKAIAKTGHDYESKVTKEATTASTGTKTYTCKNCGHSYAEEIAKLSNDTAAPQTGDETPLGVMTAVTALSAAAFAVLFLLNKKRKAN